MSDIISTLIKEFNLKPFQVENTVKLIDSGNTIPFIARYRKEMTGELNDQVLRELHERLVYLRNLEARREEVRRLIEEQGKLTEEITASLEKAASLREIEDIYRPYRPKRRTRATIAKEKGLEPLAEVLMAQELKTGSVEDIARPFINPEKEVNTAEEAINGAMDIIAEDISDNAQIRSAVRDVFMRHGVVVSKQKKEEDSVYRMYYDFSEPVAKIASHRVLAINRGEKEEFLQVKIEVPEERIIEHLKSKLIKKPLSITSEYVEKALTDSYERLIFPSVEREIRNELTETAQEQAMKVFAANLKNLLLQPPVKGRTVLGLDPAYRTGCKIAVVDDTGKVLDTTVIYPTPPQNKIEEAKKVMKYLIEKHSVDIVSIGNGTASKESEIFVAELLKEIDRKVYYMVVSEAGASVYSASKLGAEEFPDFDVALRSAVSIARRLQDPLAELVKIDPKAIGVGQYQHDMNQKRLGETLGGVVEDCVNSVGVDLNTASPSLLSYISGVNSVIAKNIVEYREANGKFKKRNELKKVKKLGDKTFEQCAGFLRIPDGDNVLDNTSVHPESYEAARKLLDIMGYSVEDVKERRLAGLKAEVEKKGISKIAEEIGVGTPTLIDIIKELLKPGRDPRDELPKPILLTDVLHLEDLRPGMVLTGTVRNVADFGAFVDIGVHQDGLVHISELSDKYVRNPMDVVSVGDIVKVKILDVDVERKRISMSMKDVN
ncbi:Tex family protein [Acetivibrio mesophilus]|uniref:RNA-binding transcriptional accessory protein n=1 Tax=Acetivibrio mesophilus TaxID=2487273 RepID=A0A4Q0I3P2_9FIRM|nr:Tex family protein [Acetivibrio mesophilus]ODM26677.1 RNA-binding transcriptional accessory protein [Clostridium sp. Bc-iso-3]RXE58890.1 RNA-binding transcriptional accessory protein [Acetivibrio mesophilus]HHV28436.1 RNA-binding transcriptional accessory protein [Clostridium sp.]